MLKVDETFCGFSDSGLERELLELPTPFYLYDLDALQKRVDFFKNQLPKNSHVHFAMKSNYNPKVLEVFKSASFGLDVVSSGELLLAKELGFANEHIVFSGVGKTRKEIELALRNKICQINVESEEELLRIANIAKSVGVVAPVAFRMNPDVDVETHPYIRTGFRDNKFGLDFSAIPRLLETLDGHKDSLVLRGLTLHIGSQIRMIEPFKLALEKTLSLYQDLQSKGYELSTFDVGGGLGIDYFDPDLSPEEDLIKSYGKLLEGTLGSKVENILLEPGRVLVARFGYLITEVQYVKQTPHKNFLIVDTGMHHLLRPSLYQAHHRILPLKDTKSPHLVSFDVVGPICESSDVLGADRVLGSDLSQGDRLAIFDVGAYGSVMSSDYNRHERPQEYVVQNGKLVI